VQKDMGCIIIVQLGRTPSHRTMEGPWFPAVYELMEDHRGDTFRAVYTVRIADAIHVLHAFQKKSKSGVSTPAPDWT